MEKKFKTPFAMICNKKQYEKIKPKLEKLGYDFDRIGFFTHNKYLVNYYGKLGTVSNVTGFTPPYNLSSFIFDTWNEDLFLALAAMVEGDVICEGEYVDGIYIDKYSYSAIGKTAGVKPLRPKATAEQLIAHFEKKEQFKEEYEVYKLYNDALKDLSKRMDEYESIFCDFSVPIFTPGLLSFASMNQGQGNVSEFVLPEKWCVKSTPETVYIISKYWNDRCDKVYTEWWVQERFSNGYWYSHNLISKAPFGNNAGSNHCSITKQDGYTEITFEQFKKYVLNKTKEMKNEPITFKSKKDFAIALTGFTKDKPLYNKYGNKLYFDPTRNNPFTFEGSGRIEDMKDTWILFNQVNQAFYLQNPKVKEVEELTMEQVCKELGREVKIKK